MTSTLTRWSDQPAVVLAAGTLGAVLVALSSFWTAATPAWFRTAPTGVLAWLPPQAPLARVAYFAGFGLVLVSWLQLGRLLTVPTTTLRLRDVRAAAVLWAAPYLIAAPVASRDLYAYAAQGYVADHGLNPYLSPPSALPGAFVDNVTARWQTVASPYGPLWTVLGRGVAEIGGSHVLAITLLLRVVVAIGFVALVLTLPPLARRVGGRPELALWAVAASPLTTYLMLGGGHNDLLMVGITSVALLVVVVDPIRLRALLVAGALAGLACAVKFPAVVLAPFLPLLWDRYAPGGTGAVDRGARRVAGGIGVAAAGYAIATAATTAVAGYGLTWTRNLSGSDHGGGIIGGLLIMLGLFLVWVLAFRWEPLAMATAGYLVVILVSPVALSWYWAWPVALAAPLLSRRPAVHLLAAVTIALLLFVRPTGQGTHLRTETLLAVGMLATWVVIDHCAWRPSWLPQGRARRTRPDERSRVTPGAPPFR